MSQLQSEKRLLLLQRGEVDSISTLSSLTANALVVVVGGNSIPNSILFVVQQNTSSK